MQISVTNGRQHPVWPLVTTRNGGMTRTSRIIAELLTLIAPAISLARRPRSRRQQIPPF